MSPEQSTGMISFGYQRDKGPVRSENQDQIHTFQSAVYGLVFLVADGMGGHEGGAIASNMAITGFKQHFQAVSKRLPLRESIAEAACLTNLDIYEASNHQGGGPNILRMGSTLVLCVIAGNSYTVAHVGDSRCYSFLNGILTRLTKDHTAVQKMVDAGMLSPEEARSHPDASVLTRAFGQRREVEFDISEPHLLDPREVLLLCSDGLYGFVEESAIIDRLQRYRDPQAAADALLQLALEAGGQDNISIYVIRAAESAPTRVSTAPDDPVADANVPPAASAAPAGPLNHSQNGPSSPDPRSSPVAVQGGSRSMRVALTLFGLATLLAAAPGVWFLRPDLVPSEARTAVAALTRWFHPAAGPQADGNGGAPAPTEVSSPAGAKPVTADSAPRDTPPPPDSSATVSQSPAHSDSPPTTSVPAAPIAAGGVIIAHPPDSSPEFLVQVGSLVSRIRAGGFKTSTTEKRIRPEGVWRTVGGDRPGFAPTSVFIAAVYRPGFQLQASRVCELIACTTAKIKEIPSADRAMFDGNFAAWPIVVFVHPTVPPQPAMPGDHTVPPPPEHP